MIRALTESVRKGSKKRGKIFVIKYANNLKKKKDIYIRIEYDKDLE